MNETLEVEGVLPSPAHHDEQIAIVRTIEEPLGWPVRVTDGVLPDAHVPLTSFAKLLLLPWCEAIQWWKLVASRALAPRKPQP